MNKIPVVKDGLKFILPMAFVTILCFVFNFLCLTTILGLLTAFVIYFFRDPERIIPEDKNLIISPADGKVIEITEGVKNIDGEEGVLIGIFLSIFNVHVNRVPCLGRISAKRYNPGQFLPAYREKISELNEHNIIVIDNNGIKIQVKQIAGLIARRIVCWVKLGDEIKKGDRFGLIRFGSRVDILVPKKTEICVKIGEKLKGGESVVGKLDMP